MGLQKLRCPETKKVQNVFMSAPQDSTINRFCQQLDEFIFFHLGSDAKQEIHCKEEGLQLCLEHPRIHAVTMQLSRREMTRLVGDRSRFETFFLDLLTSHRKT